MPAFLCLRSQVPCLFMRYSGGDLTPLMQPACSILVQQGHDPVLHYGAVLVPVLAVLEVACVLVPEIPVHCMKPRKELIIASSRLSWCNAYHALAYTIVVAKK